MHPRFVAATAALTMVAVPASAVFVQLDLSANLNRDIIFSTLPADDALPADGDRFALTTQSTLALDPDPLGLPDSGQLPFGGGTVQLAAFDADNAVHFGFNQGFSVSTGVTTPFDELTLHGFGAFGDANLGVTLNYSSGPSVTQSVVARDWTSNPASAVYLIENMDPYRTTTMSVIDRNDFSIFAISVATDASRSLVSIDVEQTNNNTNGTRVTNILAVTGNLVPEPTVAALWLLAAPGLLRRRSAR